MSDNKFFIELFKSVVLMLIACQVLFGGDPDLIDVFIKYIEGMSKC